MKKKKAPSEGESFILEYLKYKKIDFIREYKITHLKNDVLSFRVADFYLPKYKVYVEFNGRWNISDDAKKVYREKKDVYFNNNLPCVYIYPENLGIIDFILPKRLIEVLTYHSMKKELLKFQVKRLIDDRGGLFLWLFLAIIFLSFNFNWKEDREVTLVFIGLAGYQIYRFIDGYYKYFIKNIHNF